MTRNLSWWQMDLGGRGRRFAQTGDRHGQRPSEAGRGSAGLPGQLTGVWARQLVSPCRGGESHAWKRKADWFWASLLARLRTLDFVLWVRRCHLGRNSVVYDFETNSSLWQSWERGRAVLWEAVVVTWVDIIRARNRTGVVGERRIPELSE